MQIKYEMNPENFCQIPGNPIVYWISKNLINDFKVGKALGEVAPTKKGLDTGNNDYFLKYWHEVETSKIGYRYKSSLDFARSKHKWAPHDKGGEFRRWFGNLEWIINWENNAKELRNSNANLRSERFYFSTALTWSSLSSGKISFRLSDYGAISNTAGSSVYVSEIEYFRLLGFLNSNTCQQIMDLISPTLNYSAGPVSLIPILDFKEDKIDEVVIENINIAKTDWDSFETSFEFKKHPLI